MEEETKVIGNPKPEMEEVTKKKKKRNNKKNKNKKEVEESKEVIEREDNQDNHEDLLKLLTQNDNSLFEKLLNITPDFTKFDEIQFKFNEQIKSMNVLMNDIFSGNYEKIPDEEGFFIELIGFELFFI